MPLDIVYPYKATTDDFDLRYSLRSLANVEHGRVIIAGDKPKITGRNVVHVPVERCKSRYQSSTANIVAAINQADIRGDFIVMHDDIFLLEPWAFTHEHRGTIAQYLAQGGAARNYRDHIEATDFLLRDKGIESPLWFGLHTPTVYDAQRLVAMVEGFVGRKYLLRTLYHNLYPAPSQCVGDVKLYGWPGEVGPVLSISDEVSQDAGFRAWIAERFPAPCRYEIATGGKCLVLGYGETVWSDAHAAGGQFDAVIASPEAAEHRNAQGWAWGDIDAIGRTDEHCERIARIMGFAADQIVFCGRQATEAA